MLGCSSTHLPPCKIFVGPGTIALCVFHERDLVIRGSQRVEVGSVCCPFDLGVGVCLC